MLSDDYPEHLNPFDENYDPLASVPVATPRAAGRQKYNTWNSNRNHQVAQQPKPTLLEKPWKVLNISPRGTKGLVRKLSVVKSVVEKFATKKRKQLEHSASFRKPNLPPRSNSLHEDFNYRIISPKLKEKIRQQVFSRSTSTQEQENESTEKERQFLPPNGQLTLQLTLDSDNSKTDDCSPTSPESEKDVSLLGARPKTRKKRPPPPPPVESPRHETLEVKNGQEKSDDSISANSSITQDLEKDVLTDDDNSLVELDRQSNKAVDRT